MRISTQTSVYAKRFGNAAAIRAIARAGFDCYDLSMFDISEKNPIFQGGWREYIASLRAVADMAGIQCNQAHAPFPTSKLETPENAAYNEKIFDLIVRSMEAAALLGANAIVVHPKQHLDYWDHVEESFAMNMDFYRALAPYAKKFGIKIALENMWRGRDGKIVDSTCSSPEEFCRYLDTLADDCFVGCLDVGHCGLTGRRAGDMIRAMGASHIGALHVHDNDDLHDTHTIPYNGSMDWADITAALAEIGYAGDFTYEADNYFLNLPPEMLDPALAYMAQMARVLAAKSERRE